jgi:hypothetical protein
MGLIVLYPLVGSSMRRILTAALLMLVLLGGDRLVHDASITASGEDGRYTWGSIPYYPS